MKKCHYHGNPVLYAATQIKAKNWVLVIQEDPREPLEPLLRAKYLVVLLSLLGVGLITAGSVLTTNKVLDRLIRQRLGKGEER